jgi:hypothetical protein
MVVRFTCKELDRFRRDAASALLEAKRIRLSRDVSIHEDAELCREGTEELTLSLSICSLDMMATHAPPVTDLSLQRPRQSCGRLPRFPYAAETPRAWHPFFGAVRSEHAKRYQFDQSFLGWVGRGVSFTKHASQTLVPSLSVKSTRRLRSISASHFPQMSWSASLSLPIIFQTSQRGFCFQSTNNCAPEQKNKTPATKSSEFSDAAPSIKSK